MMLFLKLLFFLLAPLSHFIKTKKLYSLTLLGLVEVYPTSPITALEFLGAGHIANRAFISRGAGIIFISYSYISFYIQLGLGGVSTHTYFRSICVIVS